jgi:hypothetical protein
LDISDAPFSSGESVSSKHDPNKVPKHGLPKRLQISAGVAATAIFLTVLVATVGWFFQWKQSSRLNSLPLASRDSVEKIDKFLHSQSDPDFVLLGSSVFLVPAVYCEEARLNHSLKNREKDAALAKWLIRCDEAPELERQLSARLQKQVTVRNLAVAGSNVSDYLIETEALYNSGHKPKLIVCGLGVRDFVQSFFRMDASNNPASKLLKSSTKTKLDDQLVSDLREGCVTSLFSQPRKLLSVVQSDLTNNAPVMLLPKSDEEMLVKLTQTLTDAPKFPTFIEAQLSAYKELLRFCHDHSIPLMIIEVPKRTGWAGVIDDSMVRKIKSTIVGECKTYNIPYCNVGNGFSASDFSDDIHPNEKGGMKLFKKVAEAIVERGAL